MNVLQKLYAYLQYREAAKQANAAHRKNRNRYYVMPNAKGKIRLIVTDRYNFRQLRMKHYIDPNIRLEDVMKSCFFYTPDRKEGGRMTDEVRASKLLYYFDWYQRRLAKDRKNKKTWTGRIKEVFSKREPAE